MLGPQDECVYSTTTPRDHQSKIWSSWELQGIIHLILIPLNVQGVLWHGETMIMIMNLKDTKWKGNLIEDIYKGPGEQIIHLKRMNDRFDTYNPARPRDLPGVNPHMEQVSITMPAGRGKH